MKRVLVTGGAGFLGSHLCAILLDQGCDVLCVDNFFTGARGNVDGLVAHPNFEVMRHDILVGKHGDHIGGEREAARALVAGRVDAACIIDGNHLAFTHEGTLPPGSTRVLAQTPPYDHCNFTVFDDVSQEAVDRFTSLLHSMSYDDPAVRPLLEMEGLKAWLPGRVAGYAQLNRAVDLFGTIDAWLVHATQE